MWVPIAVWQCTLRNAVSIYFTLVYFNVTVTSHFDSPIGSIFPGHLICWWLCLVVLCRYHRHKYGLGEHYSSARSLVKPDASPHWCLHTHTHTRLMALCPGLPRWAGTRQVKPIWILLEQEIVSGNGISWAICKSAPHSRQITTPAPHYSGFLQAGCPSWRPTNSVKALKELMLTAW